MSSQPGEHNQTGVLYSTARGGKIAYMKLGFDAAYNPIYFFLHQCNSTEEQSVQTKRFW